MAPRPLDPPLNASGKVFITVRVSEAAKQSIVLIVLSDVRVCVCVCPNIIWKKLFISD